MYDKNKYKKLLTILRNDWENAHRIKERSIDELGYGDSFNTIRDYLNKLLKDGLVEKKTKGKHYSTVEWRLKQK